METRQIKIAEQEEILGVNNKNLIVSASAGSGKTTVMIRKIIKHIVDGDCHVDELLVLTYTKSAALEMKKKLTNKLRENLELTPALQYELDNIQTSDISTFDSFCQKIVKKYFYILNIDPSFSILEGSDQTFYQNKALDKAIKKLKNDTPEGYEFLLTNFSPSRNESVIKSLILEIYNYLTSIYDENEFLKLTNNLYNPELKIAENVIKSYYNNIFISIKIQLEKLKLETVNLNFDKYTKYISDILIIIDSLIVENDFAKMVDASQEISMPILRSIKEDEIGLKDKIASIKNMLVKQIDEIKKQYINSQNIEKSYKNCDFLIKNLLKLLILFKDEYYITKSKLNIFDFDDIERLTIKLLLNKEINDEIKKSYKYIFVDEFQDANKVQEKIIFLINNNNLFFVGDTKQSIYAFRQSDPEIFLNIEKKFNSEQNSCVKNLNCNFRTNKNILDYINHVFSVIMTNGTCGLDYKNTSQFISKAEYLDIAEEKCVSVNAIIDDNQEIEKLPMDKIYSVQNALTYEKKDKYDKESLFVCQKILELLGQKIYDKETGQTRAINFNDITILLLKRGKFLNKLIEHLTDAGIPFIVNVNQNLEECYDNQILFSLIKLANNFNDDYSLYAALNSPLFNFSDSELACIKQQNMNEKYFYNCFLHYDKNDLIAQKIKNFLQTLETFNYDLTYKGIYFSLDKVVRETNYLLSISFDEDYPQRKLNIRSFIDSFIESKYNYNVSDYLKYREDSLRKEKVQTDKTFSQAVEITTMHSSKGLEYHVVILPFLNVDYTKEPSYSEIKINKTLGIGIKNYNVEDRSVTNGIFYNACKIKNKEIEISEKIRLLYVATTRAKNKLILTGYVDKVIIPFENDVQIMQTNNYLSLLLGTLPADIIDKINNKNELQTCLYNNEKIELFVQKVDFSKKEKEENLVLNNVNKINTEEIVNFLKVDLSKQKSNLALKNSVSALVTDDYSSKNYAPKDLSINEHLTEKANENGILYHSLLEKIRFDEINNVQDVKDFVECNFSNEEIKIINEFGFDKIFKNILKLKTFINKGDKVLKEQKFVMKIPYGEINNSDNKENVFVQGVIDLMVISNNGIILIDYKLSNKSSNTIKQRYAKQLSLYATAINKMFKNLPISKYILSLNTCEIIEM